jgi:cytochrome c556
MILGADRETCGIGASRIVKLKGGMMRVAMRFGVIVAALAAVLGLGVAAGVAQDKEKEAAIKQRQAFMKNQSEELKVIQAYIKGEGDQAAALAKATELAANASKIPSLFPEGSSIEQFPDKTRAKPDIWANWDKFKAVPVALQSEAQKLEAAVKDGNKQGAAEALAATGKNACNVCHDTFRASRS